MRVYVLLALCVIFPVVAQLAMKKGMNMVGQFNSQTLLDVAFLVKAFTNVYVLAGVSMYALTSVLWLMVISKMPVSAVYPVISLSYIVLILAAHFFLNEPITVNKGVGSLVIVAGVFILFMK